MALQEWYQCVRTIKCTLKINKREHFDLSYFYLIKSISSVKRRKAHPLQFLLWQASPNVAERNLLLMRDLWMLASSFIYV